MSSFTYYSSMTASARSSTAAVTNSSFLTNGKLGNKKHNNVNYFKDEDYFLVADENFGCHKRIINKSNIRIKR